MDTDRIEDVGDEVVGELDNTTTVTKEGICWFWDRSCRGLIGVTTSVGIGWDL